MRNKNQNVYTVGQVNSYIKNIFDQDYMLRRIYVSGEVSNCKYHPSGHIYFSLKDAEGTISCVMFAGSRRGLAFPMRDGDNVIVGAVSASMSGTESIRSMQKRSQKRAPAFYTKSIWP